jgi:hypothetical protein
MDDEGRALHGCHRFYRLNRKKPLGGGGALSTLLIFLRVYCCRTKLLVGYSEDSIPIMRKFASGHNLDGIPPTFHSYSLFSWTLLISPCILSYKWSFFSFSLQYSERIVVFAVSSPSRFHYSNMATATYITKQHAKLSIYFIPGRFEYFSELMSHCEVISE